MPRLNRVHRVILCSGAAALLYFVGLGRPALWEPDEGRYAEIAREMVVSGDYITPRDDWVRYFEKPPLVYWSTAAAIKVFGRDEFAVRFQAAFASVGTVAVTAALGEAMFGPLAGIFAALALALSPLFFIFARFATPDPALSFFFTAALAAFFIAARDGDFHDGRSRRWMQIFTAMLALGTMAKGPVALLLGGAIATIWLLAEKRASDLIRIRWIECAALYLLIVAPWFILAAWRNPGFIYFFFVHEHLQRFVSDTEHGWGPWFFIPIVVAGVWPWLYFAPLGAQFHANEVGEARTRRGAIRFALIWFAVVFIFFSIPRAKLGEYILPALPPLAILAGFGLAELRIMEVSVARRTLGWFAIINLLLMVSGITIVTMLGSTGFPARNPLARPLLHHTAAITVIWGIGAAAVYLATRIWSFTRAAPWGVALLALISTAILDKARADATASTSYRELAEKVEPYLREGCELASYGHFVQALPFYTETRERLVDYRGELAPFGDSRDAAGSFLATDARLRELWSGSRCVILVVNQTDAPRLEAQLKPSPSSVATEGKKLALINRPLAPEAPRSHR